MWQGVAPLLLCFACLAALLRVQCFLFARRERACWIGRFVGSVQKKNRAEQLVPNLQQRYGPVIVSTGRVTFLKKACDFCAMPIIEDILGAPYLITKLKQPPEQLLTLGADFPKFCRDIIISRTLPLF